MTAYLIRDLMAALAVGAIGGVLFLGISAVVIALLAPEKECDE